MYINEDKTELPYPITAYDEQSITVGNLILRNSFILSPKLMITETVPQVFDELTQEHLAPLLELNPELLIIGTGHHSKQISGLMRYFLESKGIGVECMNTPAACRSYTVLLSEGRNMAAVFFIK